MNRRRVAILSSVLLLVFYVTFAVWSINEYRAYYNAGFEYFKERGLLEYWDPLRYIDFWYGRATLLLGMLTLFTIACVFVFQKREGPSKSKTVARAPRKK